MTPPLTPPDCDLRDFHRMMVDIPRLRGSEFDATLDDAAWRAGFNLWLTSWHQVPAASLENNDASLAKAAGLGRDVRTWRKVRDEALRGWKPCVDGRIYHPVVAETALEAWISKLAQRLASGFGNAKRHGVTFDPSPLYADLKAAADKLAMLNPKSEALSRPQVQRARAGLPVGAEYDPTGTSDDPTGSKKPRREGRKTSLGKGRDNTPKPPQGALIEKVEWLGPAEVRAAVSRHYPQDADAYLTRYCTWREVPDRALVTSSATIHGKLKACAADLRGLGWNLVLEQAVKGAA